MCKMVRQWGTCASGSGGYCAAGGNAYAKSKGYTQRYPVRAPYRPYASRVVRPPSGRNTPLVRPQMRMRSGRSYTTTDTRRKKKPNNVKSHGDNSSSSSNTIGGKFKSKFVAQVAKRIVNTQKVTSNGTSRFLSTTGKQGITSFAYMPKAQLTDFETAAQGGTSNNNTVRFLLKKGRQVITLRNQSNSNARVWLYDIVTKREPPSTALDSPVECWIKGNTDFGNTGAEFVIGQTPHFSPEFRQYYAINKVTQFELEPGMQHVHSVYHKYNKIVDSVRFQNSVSLTLAGLTRFCVVVAHGALGHEALTPATISYMPVTLDMAYLNEYSYGWIEKTQPSHAIVDSNPTAITTFNFMGESGDNDAQPINA